MSRPIRVLIVEDSENDTLLVVRELRHGGFEPEFGRVDTAQAMAAALAKQPWDLVISDYVMPHFSGIAALQLVKQSGLDVPFIVVSGSIGEDVAVAAMKAGAHDYLMKGNLQRLIPSIERELREAEVRSERRRADQEAKRNMEGIKALHEVDLAITSSLDLRSVLDVLLEKIDLFLPYTVAAVRLANTITGELDSVTCRNIDKEEWQEKTSGTTELDMMVLGQSAPVMIRNAETDPRSLSLEFFRKHGLASFLGVPLIAKGAVLGVLTFFTPEEHEFTKAEIEFLSALAGQAAIAIHNAQLYEQTSKQAKGLEKANAGLRRREEIQRLLKELSQDVTVLDHTSLLKKLVDKVREFLKVDIVDARLIESGTSQLVAISGIDPELADARISGENPRWKWFIENRKSLMVYDLTKEKEFFADATILHRLKIRGYLGTPLLSRDGELLGTIRALSYQPREFTPEEVELLQQLANGAAIAVQNARLYRDLEKSNRVKDEFLSVMSHELRTPLTVVTGYTALIQDRMFGEINHEMEKALSTITSRSNDLLSLVSSILEITRIETGKVTLTIEEVDLIDFVKDLKLMFGYAANKEITLRWNYSSGLPAIKTDGGKLKHILQNLINNAIKFTDRGSVTISADHFPDRHEIKFSVSDTGIGIPDKARELIFEKFAQVDSSDNRLYEGAGLGLYIVKKFTQLLGGTVDVKSELGTGSCFTVKIPSETSLRPRASVRPETDHSFSESNKI